MSDAGWTFGFSMPFVPPSKKNDVDVRRVGTGGFRVGPSKRVKRYERAIAAAFVLATAHRAGRISERKLRELLEVARDHARGDENVGPGMLDALIASLGAKDALYRDRRVALDVTVRAGDKPAQDRVEVLIEDLGPVRPGDRSPRGLDTINVPAIIADALESRRDAGLAYPDDACVVELRVRLVQDRETRGAFSKIARDAPNG